MEFYSSAKVKTFQDAEFQFPTGWNSTYFRAVLINCSKIVSIPNGMEFYDENYFYGGEVGSFNSQRDGILHGVGVFPQEENIGFNSQRDGILPDSY